MSSNPHPAFPDPLAQALHMKHSLDFIDKALGRATSIPSRAAAMGKPRPANVHIEEFTANLRRDEFEATVTLGDGALVFMEGTANEDGVSIDDCYIVGAEKCYVNLDPATETRLEADLYDRWREADRESKSRGRDEE